MTTKHGIKFIQTRQYNFSNKLGIDNILLPNMDFEEFESSDSKSSRELVILKPYWRIC
jgi:hypothetical protein